MPWFGNPFGNASHTIGKGWHIIKLKEIFEIFDHLSCHYKSCQTKLLLHTFFDYLNSGIYHILTYN